PLFAGHPVGFADQPFRREEGCWSTAAHSEQIIGTHSNSAVKGRAPFSEHPFLSLRFMRTEGQSFGRRHPAFRSNAETAIPGESANPINNSINVNAYNRRPWAKNVFRGNAVAEMKTAAGTLCLRLLREFW